MHMFKCSINIFWQNWTNYGRSLKKKNLNSINKQTSQKYQHSSIVEYWSHLPIRVPSKGSSNQRR